MPSGKQTAVVTTAEGGWAESQDKEIPQCSPRGVLVRVHSVALNPSDHKMPLRVKTAGLTVGIDFAGEVVEVGADANKLRVRDGHASWAVGQRVCGSVHGSNVLHPNWGSFAQFVEADPVVLMEIPEGGHWDWSMAAAVGGSVHGSVGLALFEKMQLDISRLKEAASSSSSSSSAATTAPVSNGTISNGAVSNGDLLRTVLVYGGSTACGTMAIQILRL